MCWERQCWLLADLSIRPSLVFIFSAPPAPFQASQASSALIPFLPSRHSYLYYFMFSGPRQPLLLSFLAYFSKVTDRGLVLFVGDTGLSRYVHIYQHISQCRMSLLPDQDTLKHCGIIGLYLYKKVFQGVTLRGNSRTNTNQKGRHLSPWSPPQGYQLLLLCLCGMRPGVEVWKSSLCLI